MTHINRSAILPVSDAKMFDLVNDIASYPDYLEGCVGSDIVSQSDTAMTATLYLQKRGIRMQFTTENRLDRPKCIEMQLKDGPFDHFSGRWFFQRLEDDACKVILDIEFQLSSRVVSVAVKNLFDSVSHNLVDMVVQRARNLYG